MATLEKLENGKVKITIEVPAAKFEEAVEKAYHTNGKKSPASARDMLRAR